MIIDVNESQIRSLDQVRAILDGTQTLDFAPAASPGERHEWVAQVLRRFRYNQLKRPHRGLSIRLQRSRGWSDHAQTKRPPRAYAERPFLLRATCAVRPPQPPHTQ
jgi:hypothetical protein